ncbi:hypothetical protein HK097_006738 [Rhizophlyctis rosea]|uniref:Uncharacterized protein n=1 Tax=Rhizophlyctis rosea TaxID=64517 RepID=A0AAD5SEA6_9FUNG|nr:hypothetical protein HK097_006738 [Rhizophlyctis rosea]
MTTPATTTKTTKTKTEKTKTTKTKTKTHGGDDDEDEDEDDDSQGRLVRRQAPPTPTYLWGKEYMSYNSPILNDTTPYPLTGDALGDLGFVQCIGCNAAGRVGYILNKNRTGQNEFSFVTSMNTTVTVNEAKDGVLTGTANPNSFRISEASLLIAKRDWFEFKTYPVFEYKVTVSAKSPGTHNIAGRFRWIPQYANTISLLSPDDDSYWGSPEFLLDAHLTTTGSWLGPDVSVDASVTTIIRSTWSIDPEVLAAGGNHELQMVTGAVGKAKRLPRACGGENAENDVTIDSYAYGSMKTVGTSTDGNVASEFDRIVFLQNQLHRQQNCDKVALPATPTTTTTRTKTTTSRLTTTTTISEITTSAPTETSCSSPAGESLNDMIIQNNLDFDVDIVFLAEDCSPISYGTLPYLTNYTQPTYKDHYWVARSEAENYESPVYINTGASGQVWNIGGCSFNNDNFSDLEIHNDLAADVELVFMGFDGSGCMREVYGVISSGMVRFQPTYEHHAWFVRDPATGWRSKKFVKDASPLQVWRITG